MTFIQIFASRIRIMMDFISMYISNYKIKDNNNCSESSYNYQSISIFYVIACVCMYALQQKFYDVLEIMGLMMQTIFGGLENFLLSSSFIQPSLCPLSFATIYCFAFYYYFS